MKNGLGISSRAIFEKAWDRLRTSAAPIGSRRATSGHVRDDGPRDEIRITPATIPTEPTAISHDNVSASSTTPSATPNSGAIAESVALIVGPSIRVPAIPRLADNSGRKHPSMMSRGSTDAVQYHASM